MKLKSQWQVVSTILSGTILEVFFQSNLLLSFVAFSCYVIVVQKNFQSERQYVGHTPYHLKKAKYGREYVRLQKKQAKRMLDLTVETTWHNFSSTTFVAQTMPHAAKNWVMKIWDKNLTALLNFFNGKYVTYDFCPMLQLY